MSTTKLHINLHQGVLEVEGEETFVRDIYKEFKTELLKNASNSHLPGISKKTAGTKTPGTKSEATIPKKKKGNVKSDEPKVDKTLDLSGVNQAPSLKDFVSQYQPKTNMERNVVFIGYLKDKMETDKVSMDHVWTCYHDLELNFPVSMKQSLYDTSSKKSWINVPSLDDLSLSVQGNNWLRDKAKQAESS